MRYFFQCFEVENDPEKINFLLFHFARTYSNSASIGPVGEIRNADSVHMLTFAAIMLEIDLYHDNVLAANSNNNNNNKNKSNLVVMNEARKRELINEFRMNISGTNDGNDFSESVINLIVDDISREKIVNLKYESEIEEMRS